MAGRVRRAASAMPLGLRVLVVYTIVVGNQWVAELLFGVAPSAVADVITFPAWWLTPNEWWPSPWAFWFAINLSTLAFLAASALLLRLTALFGSARRLGLFLRGFFCVLVAAVAARLLLHLLLDVFDLEYYWYERPFIVVLAGVFFGLMVGSVQAWHGQSGTRRRSSSRVPHNPFALNNAAYGKNATRYLCVAAYTDETFADRVVTELFENNLRAVSFSPGTDMSSVVRYCLSARSRRQRRDVALAVVLAATLVLSLASEWFILIGILTLYGVAVADIKAARRFVLEHLSARTWGSAQPQVPEPWMTERLAGIQYGQQGNVVVYSGFSPFLGFGDEMPGWSFTIPIVEATNHELNGRPRGLRAFTVVDVLSAVRDRLESAQNPSHRFRHDQLAGVVVKDRVFVEGNGLDGDPRLLPDRRRTPRVLLSEEELFQVALSPTGTARHYLCIHVPSWGGEVVASTFVHLSVDDRMLYIECARNVLGPVHRRYHDIDRYPQGAPSASKAELHRQGPFAEAASNLLPLVIGSPVRAIGRAMFASRASGRCRQEADRARDDLGYDYGARLSARELVVDPLYHNYFQKLDVDRQLKVTEAHVLAALLDFLDDHGVDTTEFRSRQTMLLNQGVIQSGGVSIVGNQAVGQEAVATQQVTQPAGGRQGKA